MTNETLNILIAFFCGIAAIVFGYFKRNQRNNLITKGVRTEGTVIRIEQSYIDESVTYSPVIRYITNENEWITEQYGIGSNPSAYREGDAVSIIYDPNNNTTFIIDDLGTKILGPILIVVGFILIAAAVVQYFFHPFNFN